MEKFKFEDPITAQAVLRNAMRVVLYPAHFLLRIVIRLLHLISIPTVFLILTIMTIYLVINLSQVEQVVEAVENKISDGMKIIAPIVVALGVLSWLIKYGKKTLSKIWTMVQDILLPWSDWVPGLFVKKSLSDTWQNSARRILPDIGMTIINNTKLIFTSLALGIALYCTYLPIKQLDQWQSQIKSRLGDGHVRKGNDSNPVVALDQWQVNVDESLKQIASRVGDREAGSFIWVVPPRVPALFNKGTVFSMVYQSNGDLKSKTGICPDSLMLNWLKLLRNAIDKCPRDADPRLLLEVQSFSSSAPVLVNGNRDNSRKLNCEIANQRAEAVLHLMTTKSEDSFKPEACRTVLEDWRRWGRKEGSLCTREKKKFHFGVDDKLNFDIVYSPWQDPENMANARPVDNVTEDSWRFLEAELFNRAVQIVVKNDACWRDEWTQRLGQ